MSAWVSVGWIVAFLLIVVVVVVMMEIGYRAEEREWEREWGSLRDESDDI